MRNLLLGFLMLLACAGCSVTVDHPPFNPGGNTNDRIARSPQGQIVNSYWSGYALRDGQTYSNASLTWQVPTDSWGTNSSTTSEYSSEWVGIGGFGDSTLIQLGTDQIVSASGQVSNNAWYELIPAGSVSIGQSVHAGDIMSASISCTSNCTPGATQTWNMTMQNKTQNWSWSQNFSYASSMASAEWILEAPGWPTLPLANYKMATFLPMANNAPVALDYNNNSLVMNNPYGGTSDVSVPSGGLFSTCYGSAGYTPCTTGSFTTPPTPPPAPPVASLTLTANPSTIIAGQSSTLSWLGANVTSCTGHGFSGAGISGNVNVTPTATTSYSVSCTGTDGPASASVTVKVGTRKHHR